MVGRLGEPPPIRGAAAAAAAALTPAARRWGDPNLRPLLGLAWDCGAVTTGPVTVPVLIALGIGVMKTVNQQKASPPPHLLLLAPAPLSLLSHMPAISPALHAACALVRALAALGGGRQAGDGAAKKSENALEGFGIVTLASLLPVLMVQLFGIYLTFTYRCVCLCVFVFVCVCVCVSARARTSQRPPPVLVGGGAAG